MRIRTSNPSAIAAPASAFVHGVLVQEATTWLVISGQVGIDTSGKLAGDTRPQTRRCFQNIFEVLHDNDMTITNLVKITALPLRIVAISPPRRFRTNSIRPSLP